MEQVQMVPLDKIDPPGVVARKFIDPEKILELAESIRENGLQEPILLRPVNGRYEIVFGHRRFMAHQHLKAGDIRAFVRELNDVDVIMIRAIENLQREDLSPIEEANSYYLMKTKLGLSVNEICRRTGKYKNTILKYLRLHEMPPEIQEAVDKGKLPHEGAEKLMRIQDTQMRGYYLTMAVENGATLRVLDMWVSDYEKSLEGHFNEDGGGDGGFSEPFVSKPVYLTCEGCHKPVEIGKVRNVVVCEECRKKVRVG